MKAKRVPYWLEIAAYHATPISKSVTIGKSEVSCGNRSEALFPVVSGAASAGKNRKSYDF